MKKSIFAIILVVAVVLAFFLGTLVNRNSRHNDNKASVVGVYKTDSWVGGTAIAILVLYEDGTCQSPYDGEAKWVLDGSIVRITREIGDIKVEDEAKIMESGLVLNGRFFEKVSN